MSPYERTRQRLLGYFREKAARLAKRLERLVPELQNALTEVHSLTDYRHD